MRNDVFNDSLPSMELVKGYVDGILQYELAQHEVMTRIKEKREKSSHEAIEMARHSIDEQRHSAQLQAISERREAELQAAKDAAKSEEDLAAIRRKYDEERSALEERFGDVRKAHEQRLRKAQEKDTIEVATLAIKVAQQQYNKSSIYRRAAFEEQRQQQAQTEKESLKSALLISQAEKKELLKKKRHLMAIANDETKSDEDRMTATLELGGVLDQIKSKESEISDTKKEVKKVSAAEMDAMKKKLQLEQTISRIQGIHLSKAEALKKINEEIKEQRQVQDELQVQIEANLRDGLDTSELEARLQAVSDNLIGLEDIQRDTLARSKKDDATKKSINKKASDIKDKRQEEKAENDENAAAMWEYFKSNEGKKDEGGKAIANAIGNMANMLSDFTKSVDENIDTFYEYQASVEARLQGSDESYKKLLKSVTQNVALSPFIQQKKVVENIRKLVDQGVAYNVDLRAFLATVSEDIATTFDAFDSKLLRIIRLQQADTTAARLGMEASLTKLFNEFFSDTSYLSDAFDTVSGAILDASSLLTRDQSTAFDYIVQKWLGALYSVGLSDSAVSTIAEGINMLGTGNVEALNNNDSMQTLMAMSAAKAGISYADILTGGLDADITNSLLKSMVEYLQSIANNTDNNQVTKASYANLFGISTTDLRAISNLSQADITNLYSQTLSFGDAMTELNEQFSQVSTRVHASQWIDNILENAMMGAATGIGNNMALYGTWKVLNIIEDLTGGIAIPGISVMGNMVDLHQTVTGLAKIPIAGLGLMGSLLSGLFSGGGIGNTFNLKSWGYDEYTSRGGNYKAISKGTASGVSESSSLGMVGSASASDVKATSMSDGASQAEEDAKTTNASVEGNTDVYENILKALSNDDGGIIDVAFEIKGIMSTTLAESLSQISDNVTSVENLLGTSILDGTTQLVGLSTSIDSKLAADRLFLTTNASMGDTLAQLISLLSPDRVFYTMSAMSSLPSEDAQSRPSELGGGANGEVDVMGEIQGILANAITTSLTQMVANTASIDDGIKTSLVGEMSALSDLLSTTTSLIGTDRVFSTHDTSLADAILQIGGMIPTTGAESDGTEAVEIPTTDISPFVDGVSELQGTLTTINDRLDNSRVFMVDLPALNDGILQVIALLSEDRVFDTSDASVTNAISQLRDVMSSVGVGSNGEEIAEISPTDVSPIVDGISGANNTLTSINDRLDTDRVFFMDSQLVNDELSQIISLLSEDRVFRVSNGLEEVSVVHGSIVAEDISNMTNRVVESTIATTVGMESLQNLNQSSTDVISTSVDSINTSVADATTAQTNNSIELQSVISSGAANMTDFVTSMSSTVSNIESLYNELTTENRALRVEVNNPDEMNVSIKSMSDEIKQSISRSITEAIVSSLINGGDSSEETESLTDRIANALRGLEVTITNDAFDDYLQKYTYQN